MTATTTTNRSPTREYVNLTQAAAILGVTAPTLRRRIEKDQVPLFQGRDKREVLIRRRELAIWGEPRPAEDTSR